MRREQRQLRLWDLRQPRRWHGTAKDVRGEILEITPDYPIIWQRDGLQFLEGFQIAIDDQHPLPGDYPLVAYSPDWDGLMRIADFYANSHGLCEWVWRELQTAPP